MPIIHDYSENYFLLLIYSLDGEMTNMSYNFRYLRRFVVIKNLILVSIYYLYYKMCKSISINEIKWKINLKMDSLRTFCGDKVIEMNTVVSDDCNLI